MSPFLSAHFLASAMLSLSLSLSLAVNLIKRESKREKPSLSLTLIHEDVAWGLRCNPAKSTDGFDKLSTMAPRAAPPLTTDRKSVV